MSYRHYFTPRFDGVVKKFAKQFQLDFTYSLIMRLHHNVVKTAVRPG